MLQLSFIAAPSGVLRNVPGIPDLSERWYREVAGWGAASPAVVQVLGGLATDGIIAACFGLFALLVWRARREPAAQAARAVLAPAVVVLAYLVSEVLKSLLQEERPCRAAAHLATVEPCPPVGDWSFPSNHATLAGASAVALWCVRGGRWRLGAVLAVATAFSRVYVGVHYPHDVLVGLLLGAAVACALPPVARRCTPLVESWRARPAGELLLGPGCPVWEDWVYDGPREPVPEPRTPDGTTRELPALTGEEPTAHLPATGRAEAPTVRLPRVPARGRR